MMRRETRLVALDLDGTLLTSAGTLPVEGTALLTQAAANGVHVILATTRIYDSTLKFYRAMGLKSPLICGNGAQVWAAAEGPLWAEYTINEECARIIARFADEHDWELGITVSQMHYWRQRPNQPLGLHAPNITVVATNCDAITGSPQRILVWDVQAIEAISALCRSELAEQCGVEPYVNADGTYHSLGIFAPMANKGAALKLVMQRLGITREQVVTIGDNFNDLPMFACGDISVAMRNAPDAVKQQASVVAPSNDEEGIAWALKEFAIV
jgi:Cof subfamily protein (haloacid dehalogenase superfamily)